MRCYCCNIDLEDDTGYDRPTDRFYCPECMEPTVEEQLRIQGKEIREEIVEEYPELEELLVEVEEDELEEDERLINDPYRFSYMAISRMVL